MKTHIVMVLDRSGSMQSIKSDIIGGFNKFLEEQKNQPGDAILTLAQFDDEYEIVHNKVDIKDVPELTEETYSPRSCTALLDAIGKTINSVDKDDEFVILAIITDGLENASKEFTRDVIFKMIKEKEEEKKWEITFLAANQDAIETGAGYGMARGKTMTYSGSGKSISNVMATVSSNITSNRQTGVSIGYTTKDRADAMEE